MEENPLASKIAMAALDVVKEEDLIQNARKLGKIFRTKVRELVEQYELFIHVRGRGLPKCRDH